ncbi:MAG TPA: rhamnose ABC transporter substrate-binding protein [Tepidisphaeraceae bacterium]|nr:rhamnose ABC transporter substrate-binding protein [Tepidisphaeraceae bacterium]
MPRAWMKCFSVAAVAVVMAATFAACDRSDSSSGGSAGGGGSSAGSGGAVGKIKMVYIPKNTGNPYFDPMLEGFKKAAGELGAEFHSIAPATADATSQLPIIEDQVQQGVNVLAISPNSPDALNAAFQNAMGKGITVVCVDSDLTGNESSRTVGVLPTDPKEVGFSQVELLGSLIGYKGKIAILSATTDAPNQNTWIGFMKDALKEAKYKEMQLVEVVYGNDEPQKSLTEAEALLTKYPDLRGIISPTTVGVAACAQAVETARKADQVQVTGLGTPNQMRRFIKNGTVKAFALWSPHDEGYVSAQIGHQVASGKLKPAVGAKFTAGSLGEREIREKNVVITGPPVTFTSENIDKFQF